MESKVKVQHDKTKLFGFERLYFYKVKNLDFTLVKKRNQPVVQKREINISK